MSKFNRQEKIVDTKTINNQHALIIGIGAVGREVARTIACNGVGKITMFDFDTVEDHNCVTQGFYHDDIGKSKVECTTEEILKINPDLQVISVNDRWRPKHDKTIVEEHGEFDVMFSCVDSLSMREKLFQFYSDRIKVIFDCRIGGEMIRLLSVFDEKSKEHYSQTFGEDKDAYADGCHIPMIKHSANLGASMLVSQYISSLAGRPLYADRQFLPAINELFSVIEGE